MAFPRLIALAEKAWTLEKNMDYDDFQRRLEHVYEYLDSKGIRYYDSRDPGRHPEPPCPGIK
jgi:hexosaminidase